MEVMEKPKNKGRKKHAKQKQNNGIDKEDVDEEEPVACSSNNVNISEELQSAANDVEDSMVDGVDLKLDSNDSNELNETEEIKVEKDIEEKISDDVIINNKSETTKEDGTKEKVTTINNVSDEVADNINIKPDIKEANAPVMESNEDKLKYPFPQTTSIKYPALLNEKLHFLKNENTIQKPSTIFRAYPQLSTEILPKLSEELNIKPYTELQLAALYTNFELNSLEQFSSDFVEAELKGLSVKNHPLYELLSSYIQARSKVVTNNLEIRQQRRDYQDGANNLWTLSSAVVTETGLCIDGNAVTASYTYTTATFHRSTFQTTIKMLGKIRELANDAHTLYSYTASVLKLQIEIYINNIVNNIIGITNLNSNSPIYLGLQSPPQHILPYICDLRLCISVLFQFQRKLVRDIDFIKETRDWLSQLVFLLLRLATWQDHLFILNHVLRCPPGIGSWASSFIQVPTDNHRVDDPFANYEINHAVATLALILMPVEKREKFLQEISQAKEDTAVEALWVIVDSDGEEDEESSGTSLRENDLVALLNQLPLDSLFRGILLIKNGNEEDMVKNLSENEYHILKFFSFSTTLLKIFQRGLKTYDQPRYHQFCKRLSRFIRHVVQYATDEMEILQKSDHIKDKSMLKRLQVEYDAFFLRAIYYLYSSEKLGAWQFLAVIPYGTVSNLTLWKIFYFLHELDSKTQSILDPIDGTNYSGKIWELSLREQFEEKLASLAEDECYYLLNTFANMALARAEEDMTFIQAAAMDLLQIGFISKATQDTCSKNVRILLTHITSKYPQLLSDVLKSLKENMANIGDLCLYLYEELPIIIWRPTDNDIEIISNWLLQNNNTAVESKLARMILSRLNWELVEENTLFLPYSMHCKIALLIAKAVEIEQGYVHWAWQTSFRLRLHINEKGFSDFKEIKDIENYDVIYKGVRDQQPLDAFLSVLMSSWGHLIPLVCTRGFDQLIFLQTQQKHEAVLFALNLIVPLFIDCQESLINLDKFQTILMGLLNADRTYINIAKSLVSSTNTILEQFGNMIESQIANCSWYKCASSRFIVRLWVNSLVSIPNWNRDYGVMYLLNVIIKASFFDSNALDAIISILKDLLQCATPQEQSNSISSLFKWVSNSSSQNNLLINTSLSTCPYLAFIMIGLEFEERERSTGLWNEILVQLKNQKGKGNVDVAIRKAANKLKVGSFSSGSLCIFRWAQQALDTPIDHPILALLWQKFFILYLYRVPLIGTTDRGCVGDKFFEGVINFNFSKRLKKSLQEAVDYYKVKTTDDDFQHMSSAKQLFYMSGLRVFTAFSLWLEEPRLRDSSLYLPGLPPQYEPQLLNLIMQCSDSPWLEYVDYSKMKEEQNVCIKTWRTANYRERKNINQPLKNAGKQIESDDPWERITRRLTSYDTPKSAAAIKISKSIIPTFQITDKQSMFDILDAYFKTLFQFSHNYALHLSEHKALDCTYQELIPQLYRSVLNKFKKSVPCSGSNKAVLCSGAATITIQTQEARMNDHIEHQIQLNRRDYETLLSKLLQSPSQSLCVASVVLQQVISTLQGMKMRVPETSELGVDLFYHILSLINEETTNYLPTKKLFTECLEKIGQSHINGIEFETPRLLNKILEDSAQGMYLAPHFSPSNVGTANFLLMYSMITKGIGQQYDLLYSLLSKFDVSHWLQRNNPKLAQRSQFIELIVQALVCLGQVPPKEALSLHEVYRKHLICVFQYQFPEHYGEILMAILKASTGAENDCIALTVWMDILNCLSYPVHFELHTPMREHLRQYAQNQQLLHYQELLDTAHLLSRHFTNERLQYGLYGLYPKAQNYIDVIVLFLGMSGHSLLISAMNTHQGVVGNKLCEIIWPYLRDMYAPWITPYCTNNLKDNMATWLQQLTDDRTILLPWTSANAPHAQKVVNMLFECILYIIQTLPACNNILSIVWHWYVTNFAHTAVKDHVFNVIHNSFINLPWQKFWPTITDLELMLKVAEQYLPDCHVFLGHIFMEIPWKNWLHCLSENSALPIRSRVHHCLLSLLVKLSNEPNIRNNSADKLKSLLVQAENFDWGILEVNSVEQAIDWYVMSCDSQVIFKTDPLNLDLRVLEFLKMVCFYSKPLVQFNQVILEKRHIFIRGYIRLIVVFTNRHKTVGLVKENELINVLNSQLIHLENVVNSQHEYNVVLGEVLTILNQANIRNAMLKCFDQWIGSRDGDGMAVKAVLNTLGSSVNDADCVAVLYETSILTYFNNNVSNINKSSWEEILPYFIQNYPRQNILVDALISKGCVLTLNMILLHKMESTREYKVLLNIPLQWLSGVKVNEGNESKIPLLWEAFLQLSVKYCKEDETLCSTYLYKFAHCLLSISEQKENLKWGGLLGAIGLGKQSAVSLKFLCKAMAGYVLAQLPDARGNTQSVRQVSHASCTVGQPGGNSEVVKILLKLDFGQSQGKIKECAEQALRKIQDPQNSLHNANSFLSSFVVQLYNEPYLKNII